MGPAKLSDLTYVPKHLLAMMRTRPRATWRSVTIKGSENGVNSPDSLTFGVI